MAKLLIDECLHTSLLKLAHEAGHTADHVNYLGLDSSKDWDLMKLILDRDYTFVTNNRTDFLALYGRAQLHACLLIIVPIVMPALQRELFQAALRFIGERELINAVVEVSKSNTAARISSAVNIRCRPIDASRKCGRPVHASICGKSQNGPYHLY